MPDTARHDRRDSGPWALADCRARLAVDRADRARPHPPHRHVDDAYVAGTAGLFASLICLRFAAYGSPELTLGLLDAFSADERGYGTS
jgi:hypothetical protein